MVIARYLLQKKIKQKIKISRKNKLYLIPKTCNSIIRKKNKITEKYLTTRLN